MYALGIDLGTTFTAAATWRDGHAEIASLGSRSAAIPSVVLLREDETFVTGEAADRRGMSEPDRVAREFKRRLGDTTPLLLGGVPYSAEALMARLLRVVVDEVVSRENGEPTAICVCHPANWGPYKTDLLHQAVRIAGLEVPVTFTTEPEAAATHYAEQQRLEPGAMIAVYDLGGGTFDAAVLRKTATGFQLLGQPEGIERLGGIDFDAAVFSHVGRALGGKLAELDEDDRAAIAAVSRLREECVRAKEALSADTDTSIPVLLPNLSTEIRLTRAELEAMVRPALHDTIEALKRALRSAGVTPDQLHSVLLVGGSSRMPIVSQMTGAELGRPVAVDAHPKHAVALGAAWLASGKSTATRVGAPPTPAPAPAAAAAGPATTLFSATPAHVQHPSAPVSPAARPATAAGSAAGSAAAGTAAAGTAAAGSAAAGSVAAGPAGSVAPAFGQPPAAAGAAPASGIAPSSGPPASTAPSMAPSSGRAAVDRSGQWSQDRAPSGATPTTYGRRTDAVRRAESAGRADNGFRATPPAPPARSGSRRLAVLLMAGAAAIVLLAGAAAAYELTKDDPNTPASGDPTGSPKSSASAKTSPVAAVPADEQCTPEMKTNHRWVCLTKATFDGEKLTIEYRARDNGVRFNVNGGFHLHIYGADETGANPSDRNQGTQGSGGHWYVEDQNPSVRSATSQDFQNAIGPDAVKVCARIANSEHALVNDNTSNSTFKTGNCVRITRTNS